MDLKKALGFLSKDDRSAPAEKVVQYINMKLASLGYPIYGQPKDAEFFEISKPLLVNYQEKDRLLSNYLCPADRRIQNFLNDYFKDIPHETQVRLPARSFILDRHGLARTMSLPPNEDSFISDIVSSYRVQQGVLHNPKHDRRTTKDSFHIAEGGFPIPNAKLAVPKHVFRNLLISALYPPKNLLTLPFTSAQREKAELFVSLLLRPTVCPEIPEFSAEKSLEIRFFAPGSLVSNLDFVESIFANAGDPFLPEHDAGLDIEHWTGHTGCVILAPHLITLKKKELGLPPIKDATEKQRADGMCWKSEDELYNNGQAFKVTCRDEHGIMVTLIADNYFGYCKKEVKTQISFSSNLYGLSEEEHAGGAIAFPRYDLGDEFYLDDQYSQHQTKFTDVVRMYGDFINVQRDGYGIDKQYSNIIYVPENTKFNLTDQKISWSKGHKEITIKLLALYTYVLPSGYQIHLEKHGEPSVWRLIGTVAEGTLCHKPCTVSGGGKSEISKSILDAMLQGPVFTADFHKDMGQVASIMERDFSNRFLTPFKDKRPTRLILSSERSLGSVIKLFTPSNDYKDEYNGWLTSLPHYIKDLVYVIKRHYKPEWGKDWREHFTVDFINGHPGHELKYENRKLIAHYLRVGRERDGSWRIYKLRQDFTAAKKVQVEDDITASVVIPSSFIKDLNPQYHNPSIKLVQNCEYRLFQRPDDAIHRGYDKQAEADLSSPNTFLSNYEPLNKDDAKNLIEDAIDFDKYTTPVKQLIQTFYEQGQSKYFVSSSHPRIVNGKPSKNPRYLQNRPDLVNDRDTYLAQLGTRLYRQVPLKEKVYFPVNAVLPGRRMNPPDKKAKIPALAVYNPIHYQELPELFMDFISSVTGKSPSTTGFGSEGALTKGPFNALLPVVDLNNALVSLMLTGYSGFSSIAGHIGPNFRFDHDISLLIPEIWCRMSVHERDPQFLIKQGYFEPLSDFLHRGKKVQASILGYRITLKFVHAFLGRIFNNPHVVFNEDMLKPELQNMELFAEGINNLVATQKIVADNYFKDGGIDAAIPPLKALLTIMVEQEYQGKDLNHPDIRALFTRNYVLKSDWYKERLKTQQTRQIAFWNSHKKYLETFLTIADYPKSIRHLGIEEKLLQVKKHLEWVQSPAYVELLQGTIGADPFRGQLSRHSESRISTSKTS